MHSKEKHKLAAIVFTDLVGFTKIIGRDEQEGLELLQKQRDLFFPIVKSYNGSVLKELGDGLLIMFESSIQAVRASSQIQEAAKENDIDLRIGIHIGDVVIKDKDIIGSGVNIASRIEPLASTGCICISEDVWHQIRNQEGSSLNRIPIIRPMGIVCLPIVSSYCQRFIFFHRCRGGRDL